eukprot:TRINITY_DN507_c0_g1_i1.p1 TRINITY_DN507_c0_g1~~TRINITY_DN507_c0_g1_i1.p1  ORF type:complete len:1023 (-),score=385.85 TRINITY_DN507_c0_g1_i1:36-3032(-)
MATEMAAKWNYFQEDPKSGSTVVQADHPEIPQEQHQKVLEILRKEQIINSERLEEEVNWYFGKLGLHKHYFIFHSAEEIAQHISSLYAAKTVAHATGNELELKLSNTSQPGKALYMVRSVPGSAESPCIAVEHQIEAQYLAESFTADASGSGPVSNVQVFRTEGAVSANSSTHLRIYLVSPPKFKTEKADPTETNLEMVADVDFYAAISQPLRELYQEMISEAVGKMNPVIRFVNSDDPQQEKHLLICHHTGSTHSYFSGITDMYHSLGLYATRKTVRQFNNGLTTFSIYLRQRGTGAIDTKELIEAVNLVYILPRTSIQSLFREGVFNVKEYSYAYAGWKFAYHFLARQSAQFAELASTLKNDEAGARLLNEIKKSVRREAYTEARLMDVIVQYPQIIKELYKEFYTRMTSLTATFDSASIITMIQKQVPSEFDREVLKTISLFNSNILKTNFFKPTKIALSFRLNPAFLPKAEFPTVPHGIFFLVGPEFRGFHIRFRDIARGGIRIIRSTNWQAYSQNIVGVFDENYNLAHTQERKNKDIAEGGSKGTILLALDHPNKPFTAFQKYVDCLLDVILPDSTQIDRLGAEEILFLGPDEGTANYMDWASQHARKRGYKYWKSFTTGKSVDKGGIPHDLYGMTTRSVHQYVVGSLARMGMKEEEITKVQTGGPDGDLGSNEIKISKDKTTAVVDGSGVLYDPMGIDRTELTRLAENRIMVRDFNLKKLSRDGFYVDVEAVDVKLPNGTVVGNGLDFRNLFHLNPLATADIFVPCGGRPEAVNMSNIDHLFHAEDHKTPKFKLIVEGANLFFTNDARLYLEKKGVVVYKDASANKGGVTSSSLEVLAALALSDSEFEQHMAVKDIKSPPAFYAKYVEEVQSKIEENARLEFDCIWQEHERTKTPRTLLSDIISNKINSLSTSISNSDLWDNVELRKTVLTKSIPKTLTELLGMEILVSRIPEIYARAMFGCYLASRYVYTCGLTETPEFSFFNFLQVFMKQ